MEFGRQKKGGRLNTVLISHLRMPFPTSYLPRKREGERESKGKRDSRARYTPFILARTPLDIAVSVTCLAQQWLLFSERQLLRELTMTKKDDPLVAYLYDVV